MAHGFSNPFMCVIASLFDYNVLSITLEEVFYIWLGGVGMVLLAKQVGIGKNAALLCDFGHTSGGYVVGHLQDFCWITGTAFFPFVLLMFLRCGKQPVMKNFVLGGFASFFFVSSTHPGLIIGAIYFFLFLVFYMIAIVCKQPGQWTRPVKLPGFFFF